jgi:hypothetical protein
MVIISQLLKLIIIYYLNKNVNSINNIPKITNICKLLIIIFKIYLNKNYSKYKIKWKYKIIFKK